MTGGGGRSGCRTQGGLPATGGLRSQAARNGPLPATQVCLRLPAARLAPGVQGQRTASQRAPRTACLGAWACVQDLATNRGDRQRRSRRERASLRSTFRGLGSVLDTGEVSETKIKMQHGDVMVISTLQGLVMVNWVRRFLAGGFQVGGCWGVGSSLAGAAGRRLGWGAADCVHRGSGCRLPARGGAVACGVVARVSHAGVCAASV